MKKTILTLTIIGISFGAFGQWNPTGNNETTGTVSASQFQMTSGDGKTGFYIQRPNSSDDPFKITMGSQTIKGGIMIGREDWNSKVMIPWNVGIGITNPGSNKLAVKGNTLIDGDLRLNNISMVSGDGLSGFYIQRPSSSDDPFKITMGSQTIKGGIMIGREDWNSTVMIPWDVGIGTRDTKGFKLGVKGKIAAEEVKVALHSQWSDFVFYDDYKLPTLKEVENHIIEKGHLKDIPSAKEVEKNGIFLGEMDSKLLQKIEELTLYTIQQEKKIQKLEKENEEVKLLNRKFLELQSRLEKLESEK
ncbi:hypothetical protein LNI91_11860 [Tenacibaculum dicentrarchi]|nr:hypothetical protein [Tenacibaculum dicentrarchi]